MTDLNIERRLIVATMTGEQSEHRCQSLAGGHDKRMERWGRKWRHVPRARMFPPIGGSNPRER
jgi:hypothetical protein